MRLKEKKPRMWLRNVTSFLFCTTQVFALLWVTVSYVIALYSTVRLAQPFPVETLSGQAITTILGVSALKVVENVFEHNDGVVFGHSKDINEINEDDDTPSI